MASRVLRFLIARFFPAPTVTVTPEDLRDATKAIQESMATAMEADRDAEIYEFFHVHPPDTVLYLDTERLPEAAPLWDERWPTTLN